MLIHRNNCDYNYGTTEEDFEIDRILKVYGHSSRRLFLVCWKNHPGQDSWEPEHLLTRYGCRETIKDFWSTSKLNPAKKFYPDPDGDASSRCWMCDWKQKRQERQERQAESTQNAPPTQEASVDPSKGPPYSEEGRDRGQGHTQTTTRRSRTSALGRRTCSKQLAIQIPRLSDASRRESNARYPSEGSDGQNKNWISAPYLERGSTARPQATAIHIWLLQHSRVRLRVLDLRRRGLQMHAYEEQMHIMLSHITGRSKRQEATAATTSFDIIAWIRSRRLKWVGHILRIPDKEHLPAHQENT